MNKHIWRRVEIYEHPTSPAWGDWCESCGELYTKRKQRKNGVEWRKQKLTEECPARN